MKASVNWLQSYFDEPLPDAEAIADALTFGVAEIEGVEAKGEDDVIDVKVLPDRAYLLSHRGIAKEVSLLLERPMKADPLTQALDAAPQTDKLTVAVDDFARAPAYAALLIEGVAVGPSPAWLKERLEAVGQRSINNIVDATNYVMLDLGTPLHAFDAAKLAAKDGAIGIRVRAAHDGEKITALGGASYELQETMNVIADAHSDAALAIAGIKGGTQAEVTAGTTAIVLEAAKFDPARTRRTAQALRLHTDSSHRFEHGMADTLPAYGLAAVAKLIADVAGGTAVGMAAALRPQPRRPFKIGTNAESVNRRLGTAFGMDELEQLLQRLGFSYAKVRPREAVLACAESALGASYEWAARVRYDTPERFSCSSLSCWAAIEAGYSSMPRIAVDQYLFCEPIEESEARPGDLVFFSAGNGLNHNGTYYSRLLDQEVTDKPHRTETLEYLPGTKVDHLADHLGIFLGDDTLIHASGSRKVVMRERMGGSEYIPKERWFRRFITDESERFVVTVPFERLDLLQEADLIEEIGRVYGYRNIIEQQLPPAARPPIINPAFAVMEKARAALDGAGFAEAYTYSLRSEGEIALANALASDKSHLRENLSDALAEKLALNASNLPLLGMSAIAIYEIGNVFTTAGESLHLAIAARVPEGKKRAAQTKELLDRAQAALGDAFGSHVEPLLASDESREWDLSRIILQLPAPAAYEFGPLPQPGIMYHPFSAYPFVLRDIAAWTPEGTSAGEFESMIRNEAGDLLARLDLFDQFAKDGRTSFAFHLVFQSLERTLSDEEVNGIMQQIYAACAQAGFELR